MKVPRRRKPPEPERKPPEPVKIPRSLIDFFLMERGRTDAIERFTQDGGIVSDVWYAFGSDLSQPVRVLIGPTEGVSAVEVGSVLYTCIQDYRKSPEAKAFKLISVRRPLSVSPMQTFVAAMIYVDELLQVLLPLSRWWSTAGIGRLHPNREDGGVAMQDILRDEIMVRLGYDRSDSRTRSAPFAPQAQRNIREAAAVAAVIGLFSLALEDPKGLGELPPKDDLEAIKTWVWDRAEQIAQAAIAALSQNLRPSIYRPKLSQSSEQAARLNDPDQLNPPTLIHRVFLDRKTSLAVSEGICTVKADAADRVFDISCRNITWAIIDSGIDATHPAFQRHDAKRRNGTRIKAILDFTPIDSIRNFRLSEHDAGSPERTAEINNIITELKELPDYPLLDPDEFDETARRNLNLIADQLQQKLQPDWSLIEPLIRRRGRKDGEADPKSKVVSSHGTHVAGILGADWRSANDADGSEPILRGVCPDINLYDLRVIDRSSPESSESAVLAALEYVQFSNRRTLGMKQVIHGVNISLSIPHAVRTYACGATPICEGCNDLVGSGVVVVAAAGNRGWNEQEIGFGNFVFCSITDPGNAEDVITVGSTHRERPHTYGVSYFSSRGPTGDGRIKPDLVAPGEKINGPIPDGANDELDGTSMAAPFVSGAAAMLLARHRELIGQPRRVKQILRDSATDLGREKYFQGEGLLDVLRALQSV